MSWAGQVPTHPVELVDTVYVEVPKAGCTSVKWALSVFKGGPPPDGEDIHRWFGYTHATGVNHLHAWFDTRWARMFRFTVVRNPIDRFLSFYYGLQIHERGAYGDVNRYIAEHFERDEWRNDIHAVPQTHLIGEDLERFDFVGRTEEMARVELELQSRLGSKVRIPHLNRSTPRRDSLSLESAAKLREIYWRDFEVLGYD